MAFLDSTTASGNSATPSVAVPSGVAADDIVILVAAIDAEAAVFDTGDWPSGFTELVEANVTADGHSAAVGWKRLTGADGGSYTFGDLGVASDWVCQAFAFTGRSTSDPPVATSNVQNTGQSSPVAVTATGVTAVTGDDLLWISAPDVTAVAVGNGHTAPTDYTEREDAEQNWANLSGATRENVSAGATGDVSGTFALTANTAGWAAFLVRIPAAGEPPQFARPDSDQSTGSWTATTLFSKVDETSADDGDLITSASGPSNDTCELGLSDVTDPAVSTGHKLRVRRKKSAASNNQIDMRYRLLEGATQIASWTDDTNISESAFSTIEKTLSGGEADAITDYTDLRVEIRANQNAQAGNTPTFVAAGTGSATATSGTSLTPGLPSGFAADDIHILIAHHSANGDWNNPSGWTLISGLSGNNTAAQRVNVWWRRAQGGDSGPTVTLATNTVTTVRGARIYGYRGCITTGDPWDSGSGAGPSRSDNAASATIATTSITTVAANCLVAFLQAYEDDPSTRSLPTGYTASGSVFTSTAGNDMSISAHHKGLTGTSTENPSTTVSGGTFANSVNVGILIALKPEPSANVAAQVSWVEFEVPGAADSGDTITPTATITPAGALALAVSRNRAYTATITPTAALLKLIAKPFTGTITPAGALIALRLLVRTYTATITPAGALTSIKAVLRTFTATITPAGSLTKIASIVRTYTATITPAGSLARVASIIRAFTATITPSGLLANAATRLRAYTATITPTGALLAFKVIVRQFTATITPAATFLKISIKNFVASIAPVGAFIKTASFLKTFTAAITPSGSLFKTIFKSFTALISAVGSAVVGLFGVADQVKVIVGEYVATETEVRDQAKTRLVVTDRIKTGMNVSDELGN